MARMKKKILKSNFPRRTATDRVMGTPDYKEDDFTRRQRSKDQPFTDQPLEQDSESDLDVYVPTKKEMEQAHPIETQRKQEQEHNERESKDMKKFIDREFDRNK